MSNRVYTLEEIAAIIAPIAARYDVDKIYIFGSYARGEADESSDIDLCIEAVAIKGLFALGGLYSDLEEALGKELDLITVKSLKYSTFPHQNFRKPQKKCGIEEIKILIKYEICSLSSTPSAVA